MICILFPYNYCNKLIRIQLISLTKTITIRNKGKNICYLSVIKIDNYQITITNFKDNYVIKPGKKIELILRIVPYSVKDFNCKIYFLIEKESDADPEFFVYEIQGKVL